MKRNLLLLFLVLLVPIYYGHPIFCASNSGNGFCKEIPVDVGDNGSAIEPPGGSGNDSAIGPPSGGSEPCPPGSVAGSKSSSGRSGFGLMGHDGTCHEDGFSVARDFCDKLPSRVELLSEMSNPVFWSDVISVLFGRDGRIVGKSLQSHETGTALVFGAASGVYDGVTGGLHDDWQIATSIPNLIGAVIHILLTPETYSTGVTVMSDYWNNDTAFNCKLIVSGAETTDETQRAYFTEILPSMYEKADKLSDNSYNWDSQDRVMFRDSYVATFHIGYVTEQIAITIITGGTAKAGGQAAIKSLKAGKLAKGASKEALEATGKAAGNLLNSIRGLSSAGRAKLVKAISELEEGEKVLDTYRKVKGNDALKQVMESDVTVKKIAKNNSVPTPDNQIGNTFIEVKKTKWGTLRNIDDRLKDDIEDAIKQLDSPIIPKDAEKIVYVDASAKALGTSLSDLVNSIDGLEWLFKSLNEQTKRANEFWVIVKEKGVTKTVRIFEENNAVKYAIIGG